MCFLIVYLILCVADHEVVCILGVLVLCCVLCFFFFFQAEDGIRDLVRSRGLGDVYKRQDLAVVNRRSTTLVRIPPCTNPITPSNAPKWPFPGKN